MCRRVVGISFRRRDQLQYDVVWGVLAKVIQRNAGFGLTDRLEIYLDHVRMLSGNGKMAEKKKGRSIDVLSATKTSVVVVKTAFLSLAHAIIIFTAQVNGDQKYKPDRDGYSLKKPVYAFLETSGVCLSIVGRLEELWHFQEYISDYKIVVVNGLNPDKFMFSGNSLSAKKFYLLYAMDSRHYSVITNLKDALAKR